MNINAANLLNNANSSATSAQGNQKTNSVDGNTFLTLLVAQLKNQDPLAPQDGTQFVAQLAQFNSLEQLISINQRLGDVLGHSTSSASTPAASIK